MVEPNTYFSPDPPIVKQPVADVRAPKTGVGNQVIYTYPIRQPAEDSNDFQVGVRASILWRSRARLNSIAHQSFPIHELLLGLSTLAAGGTLNALVSGVSLGTWRSVLFFVFFPALSVGCGVAYGMLRHFKSRSAQQIAEDVLKDLPDPERTIDVR